MGVEVKQVREDYLQGGTYDSFMYTSYYMRDPKDVNEDYLGHTLVIGGIVDSYHDYIILGDAIQLSDCIVIAADEDAEKYKKNMSDEVLDIYLTNTEETANARGTSDLSESEYKAICEEYTASDYTAILRNPDSYERKYIKLTGRVKQVTEGLLGYTSIYRGFGRKYLGKFIFLPGGRRPYDRRR